MCSSERSRVRSEDRLHRIAETIASGTEMIAAPSEIESKAGLSSRSSVLPKQLDPDSVRVFREGQPEAAL